MELNQQQESAVTYEGDKRNILVNAGAGCGKTRTIIARALYLIKKGVAAHRLLIVTFTNRAARELRERLYSEIGERSKEIHIGTFHAFCLKVMSQLPNSFGITGLNIIDTDDQNSLISLIRKSLLQTSTTQRRGFPKSQQLISLYSYSRNTQKDPLDYLISETDLEEEQITLCLKIFSEYQKAKEERGYLDFDDLIVRFNLSLENKRELRKSVCSLFEEVLVDEMQDTNPMQFTLLRHFSSESVRLFCVGDPAQSIYSFRGAEFKHMLNFEQTFGSSIIFPLSLNYRSFQEILDFSNWILKRSPYPYLSKLKAARGEGNSLVRVEDFENQTDESRWIVDQVVNYTEQNIALSDIMILYRSSYEARSVEAELIKRSIAYRFIGGLVLTKAAHVKDLFALLRVVRDKRDDLAWMRYLQLFPRIGEKRASVMVTEILDGDPLLVLERDLGKQHIGTEAYKAVIEAHYNPSKSIKAIINHLTPLLEQRYDRWHHRKQDFELLERVSRSYTSLSQFIDDFTLEPLHNTELESEYVDDALTLITVHSAKGSEAPICFVASANPGQYPHARSLGSVESEEEERRVLYVACTRAKNELIITRSSFSRSSFWVETSQAVGESYFLEELPSSLITHTSHPWAKGVGITLSQLQDIY